MKEPTKNKHFGIFLRGAIARLGIKKKDAAAKVGVEPVTMRHWFSEFAPRIRPENFTNLAKLLGTTEDALREKWVESLGADPDFKNKTQKIERISRQYGPELSEQISLHEHLKNEGIAEDSVDISVGDIPTFDLAIAAGPWTEVGEAAFLNDPKQIIDGRFRIRLRGDSMEPDYADGCLVEFRALRLNNENGERDELKVGEDYYVQVAENATFKRLAEITDETLVFRAVNKKKYPKPIVAPMGEVLNMAVAEWLLSKPRKEKK